MSNATNPSNPANRSQSRAVAASTLVRRLALETLLTLGTLFALAGTLAASMAAFATAAEPPAAPELVGHWHGALAIGELRLRLVFHVTSSSDGQLQATLDSPDQQATGIPVAAVEVEDDTVRFDIRALSAVFAGRLSADLEAIEGEWRQSGQVLPLAVRRGDG